MHKPAMVLHIFIVRISGTRRLRDTSYFLFGFVDMMFMRNPATVLHIFVVLISGTGLRSHHKF